MAVEYGLGKDYIDELRANGDTDSLHRSFVDPRWRDMPSRHESFSAFEKDLQARSLLFGATFNLGQQSHFVSPDCVGIYKKPLQYGRSKVFNMHYRFARFCCEHDDVARVSCKKSDKCDCPLEIIVIQPFTDSVEVYCQVGVSLHPNTDSNVLAYHNHRVSARFRPAVELGDQNLFIGPTEHLVAFHHAFLNPSELLALRSSVWAILLRKRAPVFVFTEDDWRNIVEELTGFVTHEWEPLLAPHGGSFHFILDVCCFVTWISFMFYSSPQHSAKP